MMLDEICSNGDFSWFLLVSAKMCFCHVILCYSLSLDPLYTPPVFFLKPMNEKPETAWEGFAQVIISEQHL